MWQRKARKMDDGVFGDNREILLTLPQAAAYCGYKSKRNFMENWVRKHKVPYDKRGNRNFFLKSVLDRWLLKVAEANARKFYR